MIKTLFKFTIRKLRALKYLLIRQYKAVKYNSLRYQKEHWEEQLRNYDWNSDKLYGYDWGDPEKEDDRLGNYLEVKNRLLKLVAPEKTVLEIGSLAGKWTQYLLHAKKCICVDINKLSFEYIQRKLPHENISFYLTKGNELKGIPDNSVDVVFSLDTFGRVPQRHIRSYFRETARVLKSNGRIFLFLPCREVDGSRAMYFVNLSTKEIYNFCKENNFDQITIDKKIVKHGVILEAIKST